MTPLMILGEGEARGAVEAGDADYGGVDREAIADGRKSAASKLHRRASAEQSKARARTMVSAPYPGSDRASFPT
jgi:hypothetical protein